MDCMNKPTDTKLYKILQTHTNSMFYGTGFTVPDFNWEMSRVAAPSSRLEDLPKYRCIALTSILNILLP